METGLVITSMPGVVAFYRSYNLQGWGDGVGDGKGERDQEEELLSFCLGWGGGGSEF